MKSSTTSVTRLVLIDGLIKRGGLFALWMLIAGYFVKWIFEEGVAIVDYLLSGKTWTSFGFHFLFFGLFMAIQNWLGYRGSKVEKYTIT